MLPSWRWYGPADPVSLRDACQAGAIGIVTALHALPNGAVWPVEAIEERKRMIAAAMPGRPLRWVVVESVPVHESIKTRSADRMRYIETYQQTLVNLGACGIDTVCYNFMPVVDWTRTDLAFRMPDESLALRFDAASMAAFDCYILQRPEAEGDYDEAILRLADQRYREMTSDDRLTLARTILAGLPGSEEAYDLATFRQTIDAYREISASDFRRNLIEFLEQVVPVAADAGVRMAIHPDDPPFPILGLPRVVSTEADVRALFDAVDLPQNGLTFCTGSFGVRPDNDLIGMVRRLADRIHFAHLRSTRRESDGSFFEADHLDGDVDMVEVVRALVDVEESRRQAGRSDVTIPMRPDHGHQMLDDLAKTTNPGYSAIGRLRGLAELRGVEYALRRN